MGEGVFVENNGIYAGIVGKCAFETCTTDTNKKTVLIKSTRTDAASVNTKIEDYVIAKVVRIAEETVFVEVLAINGQPTSNKFEGVLKKRDIREKEIDKIVLDQCFLPGDVIKAQVCSYGDSRKIQLSTVADDLGVIFAVSESSGNYMVPVNEEEMMCPKTQVKERRKAAMIS